MAARWFCLIDQQQYGPFSGVQIQQLAQQGQLRPADFVRTETDSNWTSAADLPGLFPAVVPTVGPAAAQTPVTAAASPTARARSPNPQPAAVKPSTARSTSAPPAVAPSAPSQPTAKRAVPTAATPVANPAATAPTRSSPSVPSAAPVATPVAAPVAAPMATPIAAPIAAPLAVPVTGAVAPAGGGAPPGATAAGAARARPATAARPIALNPQPLAAAPVGTARTAPENQAPAYAAEKTNASSNRLVVGLAATVVGLVLIAVVLLVYNAGKNADRAQRRDATAAGGELGDPEIEAPAVIAPADETVEIADPSPDPDVIATDEQSPKKTANLSQVGRWLVAGRQKGGLKDIVRMAVGNVWRESTPDQRQIVTVEVQVTNLSKNDPLDFTGWRPDVQPDETLRAILADDQDTLLPPAPPAARQRPAARRRIDPGQTETEELRFVMPTGEAKEYRLALPYGAVGQTGQIGFELPAVMLKDRSSDDDSAAATAASARPSSEPEPAATMLETDRRPPTPPESKTADQGASANQDTREPSGAMDAQPPEPADNTAQPMDGTPENIPDIRKLINES